MFDDFKPDKQKGQEIPYFEDLTLKAGWEGMSTGKTLEKLKEEIERALSLLDAKVTGFLRGTFGKRTGYRISFILVSADGTLRKGQLDVAALPVKANHYSTREKHEEQSLKTALFNLRDNLECLYRMRFIQPGFDPMMAWTLTDQGKTLMQLWNERMMSNHLLPAGKEDDFIDAEVREQQP